MSTMRDKQYKNIIMGARNKATGDFFESLIEASCVHYSTQDIALIEKTPEPMRVIKEMGEGKFLAHFEKRAQPDYKGTLKNGQAIIFEAKHTESDRIEQNRLTSTQQECLYKHYFLGAQCYVFVTYRLQEYYFVPWFTWVSMKELYGRKYMTVEELRKFQVPYKNGVIKFLNNVVIEDRTHVVMGFDPARESKTNN